MEKARQIKVSIREISNGWMLKTQTLKGNEQKERYYWQLTQAAQAASEFMCRQKREYRDTERDAE